MTAINSSDITQTPSNLILDPDKFEMNSDSDIWKKLQEVQTTHRLALNVLVMIATLCIILSEGKEWVKLLVLNALASLANEKDFCHIGLQQGLQLGYLVRGIHNLALAAMGDLSAATLLTGIFWTTWSINISRYL